MMITRGKLDYIVEALVGEDLVNEWWDSSNKAFEGMTPSEMLMKDPVRVKEYLVWHAYCAGG